MNLIARGEGTYNSYNRGTMPVGNGESKVLPANSVVDFSAMTLAEIQRRQALKIEDPDRMRAVGRYQMITPTLAQGIDALKLDLQEKFDPDLQDRFFNDFLISVKAKRIRQYISGKPGVSLRDAQKDVCTEWASVEDPDTPGQIFAKYVKYGNKMHTSAASVAVVIEEMRSHYQARVQEGMTPSEAWRATSSMGPGEHSHALRSRTHAHVYETLRKGAHGSAVADYQRHLQSLGYLTADGRELSADGHFGDDTRAATEAFQRDHGLEADGVAGKRTMAAVADAVSPPSIGDPSAPYLHESSSRVDSPYLASADLQARPALYEELVQQPLPPFPSLPTLPRDEIASVPRSTESPRVDLDEPGVRKLQDDLNAVGITNHHGEPLAANGQYNDETRMAVMGFQMDLGLPASGEPDVATVALADARASIARLQPLRDVPQMAEQWQPEREPEQQHDRNPAVEIERAQATTVRPFSDPAHPQHALYADLREQLPEEISEMRLAQFTAACHKGGIGPGELEAIQIIDDRAVFVGGLAGYAEVNMAQTPTIEQSVQQAQAFDQQQLMDMNQRTQELQQAQGMSMSM